MIFIKNVEELENLMSGNKLVFFGVDSSKNSKLVSYLTEVEKLYPNYVESCMAIPPSGMQAIIKYQAHVTPTVLIFGKNKYDSNRIELHARLVAHDVTLDNLIGLVPEYADLLLK